MAEDRDKLEEIQSENDELVTLYKGLILSLESISERVDAVLSRAREALERIEIQRDDRGDGWLEQRAE